MQVAIANVSAEPCRVLYGRECYLVIGMLGVTYIPAHAFHQKRPEYWNRKNNARYVHPPPRVSAKNNASTLLTFSQKPKS